MEAGKYLISEHEKKIAINSIMAGGDLSEATLSLNGIY
jgi:hypothetical protein